MKEINVKLQDKLWSELTDDMKDKIATVYRMDRAALQLSNGNGFSGRSDISANMEVLENLFGEKNLTVDVVEEQGVYDYREGLCIGDDVQIVGGEHLIGCHASVIRIVGDKVTVRIWKDLQEFVKYTGDRSYFILTEPRLRRKHFLDYDDWLTKTYGFSNYNKAVLEKVPGQKFALGDLAIYRGRVVRIIGVYAVGCGNNKIYQYSVSATDNEINPKSRGLFHCVGGKDLRQYAGNDSKVLDSIQDYDPARDEEDIKAFNGRRGEAVVQNYMRGEL